VAHFTFLFSIFLSYYLKTQVDNGFQRPAPTTGVIPVL